MPRYELSPEQESIVRKLVEQYDAGHTGEFMFATSFKISGFQFHGVHKIEASMMDLNALVEAGMIRAQVFDMGDATCSLIASAAKAALRSGFGGSTRRRVLEAVYDIAGGNPNVPAKVPDICKRAKVSQQEFEGAILSLGQEGLLSGNAGVGNGPHFYIQGAGAREVERGGERSDIIAGVNIGQVNFDRSNMAIGSGNVINAHQNNGINSAELASILSAKSDDALAQIEAIRTLLPQVAKDAKDGKTSGADWTGRITKLAAAGAAIAGFGETIGKFIHELK